MKLNKKNIPSLKTCCFCLVIFFVYSTNEKFFGVGKYFVFPILTVLTGIVPILLDVFFKKTILKNNLIILLIIAYIFLSISLFNKEFKYDVVAAYSMLLGMLYVMTYKPLRRTEVQLIVYVYIISALILSIQLLTQLKMPYPGILRFTVFYSFDEYYDANFLGAYLLVPAILASYKGFFCKKNKLKFFFQISTIIILIAMFLTGSRGAIVGFLIGIGVILFSEKNIIKIAIISIACFLLIMALLPEELYNRFFEESYIDTNQKRLLDWTLGFGSFMRSPFLGNGFDWSMNIINRCFHANYTAHNTYIVFLMNFGLLGIIPFVIFICKPFKFFFKNKSAKNIFASYLAMLFSVLLIEATGSLVFFIPLTVLYILYQYKSNNLSIEINK